MNKKTTIDLLRYAGIAFAIICLSGVVACTNRRSSTNATEAGTTTDSATAAAAAATTAAATDADATISAAAAARIAQAEAAEIAEIAGLTNVVEQKAPSKKATAKASASASASASNKKSEAVEASAVEAATVEASASNKKSAAFEASAVEAAASASSKKAAAAAAAAAATAAVESESAAAAPEAQPNLPVREAPQADLPVREAPQANLPVREALREALVFGVRANVLSWATLSPGLGIEVMWNQRYLAAIDGSYGDWALPDYGSKLLRLSGVGAEVRRYFTGGATYEGLFVGTGVRWVSFNHKPGDIGRHGTLWMAGINVGYTLPLSTHWAVEAAVGAGYLHQSYDRYTGYDPAQSYLQLGHRTRNTFGLTNAAINVAYRFKL